MEFPERVHVLFLAQVCRYRRAVQVLAKILLPLAAVGLAQQLVLDVAVLALTEESSALHTYVSGPETISLWLKQAQQLINEEAIALLLGGDLLTVLDGFASFGLVVISAEVHFAHAPSVGLADL